MTTRKETYEPSDSSYDSTTLHEAVLNGDHSLVAAIIDSGMRLDSTDKYGDNALHLACRKAGDAVLHIRNSEELVANFNGIWYSEKTMERMREELEKSRKEGVEYYLTVKRLLDSGQFDLEDKNDSGKTPLDIAIEYGAKWIGALLVGQDPETDEVAARIGGMDIFHALYHKDKEALEALLDSGAELQTVCEHKDISDFNGNSPLACALIRNNVEAAERILQAGADPNYRTPKERTAFAMWIEKNERTEKEPCLSVLQQMIRCGWQPEQPVDKEGNTALSFVCRHPDSEMGRTIINYLVSIGANVNARNQQGQTPIMNLYGGRFWDGRLPFYPGLPRNYPFGARYCRKEDAEVLKILLKAGAEMDSTDKWGNSVLHYIAASARSNAAKSAVEILFNFGRPDMEAVNNEGETAMDIAAKNNDEALVKFLLKHS